jgi:hypothetical protein
MNNTKGTIGVGNFNLKIKLKNEASLKNIGASNKGSKRATSDKKNAKIIRSSTKEEAKEKHHF